MDASGLWMFRFFTLVRFVRGDRSVPAGMLLRFRYSTFVMPERKEKSVTGTFWKLMFSSSVMPERGERSVRFGLFPTSMYRIWVISARGERSVMSFPSTYRSINAVMSASGDRSAMLLSLSCRLSSRGSSVRQETSVMLFSRRFREYRFTMYFRSWMSASVRPMPCRSRFFSSVLYSCPAMVMEGTSVGSRSPPPLPLPPPPVRVVRATSTTTAAAAMAP